MTWPRDSAVSQLSATDLPTQRTSVVNLYTQANYERDGRLVLKSKSRSIFDEMDDEFAADSDSDYSEIDVSGSAVDSDDVMSTALMLINLVMSTELVLGNFIIFRVEWLVELFDGRFLSLSCSQGSCVPLSAVREWLGARCRAHNLMNN